MPAEVWRLQIIAEISRTVCNMNSKNLADPWVAYINERGNKSFFLPGKLPSPNIHSSKWSAGVVSQVNPCLGQTLPLFLSVLSIVLLLCRVNTLYIKVKKQDPSLWFFLFLLDSFLPHPLLPSHSVWNPPRVFRICLCTGPKVRPDYEASSLPLLWRSLEEVMRRMLLLGFVELQLHVSGYFFKVRGKQPYYLASLW